MYGAVRYSMYVGWNPAIQMAAPPLAPSTPVRPMGAEARRLLQCDGGRYATVAGPRVLSSEPIGQN